MDDLDLLARKLARESSMPIEILHVGAGMRGENWLDFVAQHPETTSVACVEPVEGVRAKAGARLGADKVFANLDEALGKVKADACLIVSPSHLHVEQALKALDAGLAVMIEKPFATSVADALRVIERSRSTGKPVVIAEQFRWVPAERTVRRAVREGLLGQVFSATLADRRRMPKDMQGRWAAELDYVQLQEIAVHHFDSLRAFFDRRPLSVAAQAWNPPSSDYRHGACTQALIEMEDDLRIEYLGTLTSPKFGYRLVVEGDRGTLWTNRKHVLVRTGGSRFFKPLKKVQVPPGDGDPYPREGTTSLIEGLVAAVRTGETPETSAEDNLWTIAMMEAGIRSDRERRTVDVREVLGDGPA